MLEALIPPLRWICVLLKKCKKKKEKKFNNGSRPVYDHGASHVLHVLLAMMPAFGKTAKND